MNAVSAACCAEIAQTSFPRGMAFSINGLCASFLHCTVSGASSAEGVQAGKGHPNGLRNSFRRHSSTPAFVTLLPRGKKGRGAACSRDNQKSLVSGEGKWEKLLLLSVQMDSFADCSVPFCWPLVFSVAVSVSGNKYVCCVKGFVLFLSSWTYVKSFVNTICRHCCELSVHQRAFCGEGHCIH